MLMFQKRISGRIILIISGNSWAGILEILLAVSLPVLALNEPQKVTTAYEVA